jgi:hypothetical protein
MSITTNKGLNKFKKNHSPMTVRTWRIIVPGMLLLPAMGFTGLLPVIREHGYLYNLILERGAGGPAYGQAGMRTNGLSVRCK